MHHVRVTRLVVRQTETGVGVEGTYTALTAISHTHTHKNIINAENTAKHRGGGVGSVVANHRGGGESSMVVTTLIIIIIIWPHRSNTYADAVYCYRWISTV